MSFFKFVIHRGNLTLPWWGGYLYDDGVFEKEVKKTNYICLNLNINKEKKKEKKDGFSPKLLALFSFLA